MYVSPFAPRKTPVNSVETFAETDVAQRFAEKIRKSTKREWTIMEICGGHTHTILANGIDEMLKGTVSFEHGAGCAVCITPLEEIDRAIALSRQDNVTVCVYGELLRIPGTRGDLLDAKAQGADVRVVYSPLDCIEIAQKESDRHVVFFSVGSETSLYSAAYAVWQAAKSGLHNFYLLSTNLRTAPTCNAVLEKRSGVQAVIAPGESCSVFGYREYESISRQFRLPIIVTGQEPSDMMEAIYRCVLMLETNKCAVENQYARSAARAGNPELQGLINRVFEPADANWRRLGAIKSGAFALKSEFKQFDAAARFALEIQAAKEAAVCISDQILFGLQKPFACSAFGKACTPEHPLGATMISSEGTCALYYKHRKAGA